MIGKIVGVVNLTTTMTIVTKNMKKKAVLRGSSLTKSINFLLPINLITIIKSPSESSWGARLTVKILRKDKKTATTIKTVECQANEPGVNMTAIRNRIILMGLIIDFQVNEKAIRQFLIRGERAGITSASLKPGKKKENSTDPLKTAMAEILSTHKVICKTT